MAFANLRKDNDFTDVTLACQDGNQVEAHKVILAASSPFFQNLLKRIKHAHPLIYMRGANLDDLLAIVNFLYYGETDITQGNLDSFLNLAEELELKGLNGKEEGEGGGYGETPQKKIDHPPVPSRHTHKKNGIFETKISAPENLFLSQSNPEDQIIPSMSVVLPKQQFSGDLKELDGQIETMMGRGENMIKGNGNGDMVKVYVCKVCGKEGLQQQIKRHIEANHIEGISIPCSLCEKTFKSRKVLCNHKRTHN